MISIDFSSVRIVSTDPLDQYSIEEREYVVQHSSSSFEIPIPIDQFIEELQDDAIEIVGIKDHQQRMLKAYAQLIRSEHIADLTIVDPYMDTTTDPYVIGTSNAAEPDYVWLIVVLGIHRLEFCAMFMSQEEDKIIAMEENFLVDTIKGTISSSVNA